MNIRELPANANDARATAQERQLIDAGLAEGILARALGLSFADRDVELIEYLKSASLLPDTRTMPGIQACAELLHVEPRWAAMVLERVGQFIRKAARGADFSAPVAEFESQPPLHHLSGKLKTLRPGMTVFIGDSNMDGRHWSCDAPFPVLAGSHVQHLGIGAYMNAGIGGQTARDGIERFDRDVAAHDPVRVVISFAGNDLAARLGYDQILTDLDILSRRSRDGGATVTLLGLADLILDRLWWTGSAVDPATNVRRQRMNREIRDYCRDAGLMFLDVASLIGSDHICSDGIHLNQQGHDRLALNLLRQWCGENAPSCPKDRPAIR